MTQFVLGCVTCTEIRYLGIDKWARVLVRNVWAVGEFWQSCSPFPIGVAAIFFFLQSHYIGMLRSQSSCIVRGSMRNRLTPSCKCGEMAALRMTRTPKNIGRKFWYNLLMKMMSSSWHKWCRLMKWQVLVLPMQIRT